MATTMLAQPDLATDYAQNGFVIVPNVLDELLLEETRAEALEMCKGNRGNVDGLEPSMPGESDEDVLRRTLCVHFPHKISEQMAGIAHLPSITSTLTSVIGPNVKMMQSMLFIKSAGKPGQGWHQDETPIPTRDRSLTGVWIALDDATVDNGCLWVIPGSHRPGVLYPDRDQTDPNFDCSREAYGWEYSDEDAIPVELPAGAAVIFNGYLLHRSLPNVSDRMRRSLVFHYMSAESLLPWFAPTGEQRMGTVDHRDIVMVAGVDPYAYKGTTDIMRPEIRPDGEGGCISTMM